MACGLAGEAGERGGGPGRGSGSGRLRRTPVSRRHVDHGGARSGGPWGPPAPSSPGDHGPEKPAARPVGADPKCLRRPLLPGSSPSATAPPSAPRSRAQKRVSPQSPRHNHLPNTPWLQTASPREEQGAGGGVEGSCPPLSSSRRGPAV